MSEILFLLFVLPLGLLLWAAAIGVVKVLVFNDD